jgi:sterol desaturase/sphingolipid hydroxylase (fatty acid hydroxylase superfamily)
MSIIQAAIPLFLALIAAELWIARARGLPVHRLNDSIADLGCGVLSQVTGIFIKLLSLGAYALVAEHWAVQGWFAVPAVPDADPLSLLTTPPFVAIAVRPAAVWVTVFLLVDLGQYLLHRLSHRVSLLWACHVVHHSSEELNYAVALRNSSLHGLFLWVFFLPLALVGVPWRIVGVCYALNVVYQFWLHTRLVGRLGPLELVLNTPSHHRVHHGVDPKYLDRNYGGVLIVWDRLFGTFQLEEEEPTYGVTRPLASWNAVWANLDGFADIARRWRASDGWGDRLRAVFGPPEWEPAAGGGAAHPAGPAAPIPANLPRALLGYVLLQFSLVLVATLFVLSRTGRFPLAQLAAFGGFVMLSLGNIGGLMEERPWARRSEEARQGALAIAAFAGVLAAAPGSRWLPAALLLIALGSGLWLAVLVSRCARPVRGTP